MSARCPLQAGRQILEPAPGLRCRRRSKKLSVLPGGQGRRPPAQLRILCRSALSGRAGTMTAEGFASIVGLLTRLAGVEEMEKEILKLAKQGHSDEEIADRLTRQGCRSPRHPPALPSTVKIIRLRHRLFIKRCQSHPRRRPVGADRVAGGPRLWRSRRTGSTTASITARSRCLLHPELQPVSLPDRPQTLTLFKQLRAGRVQKLRF